MKTAKDLDRDVRTTRSDRHSPWRRFTSLILILSLSVAAPHPLRAQTATMEAAESAAHHHLILGGLAAGALSAAWGIHAYNQGAAEARDHADLALRAYGTGPGDVETDALRDIIRHHAIAGKTEVEGAIADTVALNESLYAVSLRLCADLGIDQDEYQQRLAVARNDPETTRNAEQDNPSGPMPAANGASQAASDAEADTCDEDADSDSAGQTGSSSTLDPTQEAALRDLADGAWDTDRPDLDGDDSGGNAAVPDSGPQRPLALPPPENQDCKARNRPGVAYGGFDLPYITEKSRWFRGSQANLAPLPRQVADAVRGHLYRNFGELREEIWETIGRNAILAKIGRFDLTQVQIMKTGNAPFSLKVQQSPGRKKYEIHHITPINRGGGVYDLGNLVITTPLTHGNLLERSYHYGRNGIK